MATWEGRGNAHLQVEDFNFTDCFKRAKQSWIIHPFFTMTCEGGLPQDRGCDPEKPEPEHHGALRKVTAYIKSYNVK